VNIATGEVNLEVKVRLGQVNKAFLFVDELIKEPTSRYSSLVGFDLIRLA
jgi:hypothetical protein